MYFWVFTRYRLSEVTLKATSTIGFYGVFIIKNKSKIIKEQRER